MKLKYLLAPFTIPLVTARQQPRNLKPPDENEGLRHWVDTLDERVAVVEIGVGDIEDRLPDLNLEAFVDELADRVSALEDAGEICAERMSDLQDRLDAVEDVLGPLINGNWKMCTGRTRIDAWEPGWGPGETSQFRAYMDVDVSYCGFDENGEIKLFTSISGSEYGHQNEMFGVSAMYQIEPFVFRIKIWNDGDYYDDHPVSWQANWDNFAIEYLAIGAPSLVGPD